MHCYLVMKIYIHKLVFISIIIAGCRPEEFTDCFKGSGKLTTTSRVLEPFQVIILENKIDLTLIPDSLNYLQISCGENLHEPIATDVKEGVIHIRDNNRCTWSRSLKIRPQIEVHYQSNLQKLESRAVSTINGIVKGTDIKILIESSENSDLSIEAKNNLEVKVSGSGNLYLKGYAPVFVMEVFDTGVCDARNLKGDYSYVYHHGVNDCYVQPEKALGAQLTSLGNLIYYPEPWELIRYPSKGSGRIIKGN